MGVEQCRTSTSPLSLCGNCGTDFFVVSPPVTTRLVYPKTECTKDEVFDVGLSCSSSCGVQESKGEGEYVVGVVARKECPKECPKLGGERPGINRGGDGKGIGGVLKYGK